MPRRKERFLQNKQESPFLKQLQLLTWSVWQLWLVPIKQFYVTELLVGDTHDANFSELWQYGFYSFPMNLGILHAGTMADVDGELEHRESILNETFAKVGVFFDVFLRLSREVEQN